MVATGAVVTVTHERGRYPVYIEPGALGRLGAIAAEHLPARRLAVIADATVAEALGPAVAAGLPRDEAFVTEAPTLKAPATNGTPTLTFPAGEASKTRETWARLSDELLARGFGRDSAIVALGGGVTGDLAGFVAATYLRGIPYLQAPTTLLAMVDASVGGKTGVDTAHGKNLIGAFYPPAAVVADPDALATLPERHYRAGFAEAVKHGLIADADHLAWLARHADALRGRDRAALVTLVRRSVEIKADVVSGDEREAGRRATLNVGHSVAHAVEHVSGYTILHGEAVALGLVAECALAEQLGIAAPGLGRQVGATLTALGLPVALPRPLSSDALLAAMAADKKNRRSKLRLALPRAAGAMHQGDGWTVEVAEAAVRRCLQTISP